MRWSVRQLEVFMAIVEENGFSAAGEKLSLAQPAVSIALRKLEEALGVRLLERSPQGVRLTGEGTLFLAHARAIRSQMNDAERDLRKRQSLEAGSLTLGVPPMVASYFLPSIVDRFLKSHPRIRVRVLQQGANIIAEMVRSGEIDLGFVADWNIPEDLETTLLENQPIVACVPESSKLAKLAAMDWSKLFSQPLVLFPKGYHQRARIDEAALRTGNKMNVAIEAESTEFMTAMVRAGRGVCTLLDAVANGRPGIVSVRLPPEAVVPIGLCRRGRNMPSLAASAFFDSVLANLPGKSAHRRPRGRVGAGWHEAG
jgi:DNA-binding transcriptional LysR family regulator